MRKTPGYYLIRPYENGEMLTIAPTNQGKMIYIKFNSSKLAESKVNNTFAMILYFFFKR